MSFTISPDDKKLDGEIAIKDEFYIPFWIILQFLDTAPPDPFIKVEISSKRWNNGVSPEGPIQLLCCDLKWANIEATDIPASYLIKPEDLSKWATNIGDWFKNFPDVINKPA